jgi:hypothetical protein
MIAGALSEVWDVVQDRDGGQSDLGQDDFVR